MFKLQLKENVIKQIIITKSLGRKSVKHIFQRQQIVFIVCLLLEESEGPLGGACIYYLYFSPTYTAAVEALINLPPSCCLTVASFTAEGNALILIRAFNINKTDACTSPLRIAL